MKQITFVLIVLLLAIQYAYADGNTAEETDYRKKVRQLDQLAERFKAETGFTGNVSKDYNECRMRTIIGKFRDISFPDLADTLAMRQSCDAVLAKIIPYVGFQGLTLTKECIGYNKTSLGTYYTQLVHGYSFEWRRGIDIRYESDTGKVDIVVGISKINIPPVHVKYTFAQAVEIARQYYINTLEYPDTLSFEDSKNNAHGLPFPLPFDNIRNNDIVRNNGIKYVYDKGQYRLCHIFGISISYGIAQNRAAYIDAQTGEIHKIYDDGID